MKTTNWFEKLGHDWSWADLSVCRKYRYALGRRWKATGGTCLWVMLNPSTADHSREDPTVRRVIGYSVAWGYGAMVIVNLWPIRSPSPDNIFFGDRRDSLGPDGVNDGFILNYADQSEMVMCAWGAHGQKLGQGEKMRQTLVSGGLRLHALRFTKSGQPCHPLYLPKKLEPTEWRE